MHHHEISVRVVLVLLLLPAFGCEPEESPQTAALLDGVRCPPRGSRYFFADSSVASLDPFDDYVDVGAPTWAETAGGARFTWERDGQEVRRLTVTDGAELRHYCGGEASLRREEEDGGGDSGPPVWVRSRYVLRDVKTGAGCDLPVSGEITLCYTP